MAFATMIRQSSAAVSPLAMRLVGKIRHHTSAALLLSAVRHGDAVSRRRFFPSAANFSTEAVRVTSSNKVLLKYLDSEIDCADEEVEKEDAEDIPENFPFEIEDIAGENVVKLTRQYENERVEVEVYGGSGENEDDGDKDDDYEDSQQTSLNLSVKITKDGGRSLEFRCSTTPDEIHIDDLEFKDPEDSEDKAYTGPYFVDLDEVLQKAFYNYLAARGISSRAMNYMHEYMVNKETREYKIWLKNLKKFVEA